MINFPTELAHGEKKPSLLAARIEKECIQDYVFEEAAKSGCAVSDSEKNPKFDFGDEQEINIFNSLQMTLRLVASFTEHSFFSI